MRFIASALLALGLLLGAPVFSYAQQGDVNATIPGEGYQGWAGTYGGAKILQYCYFNRFLGEPYAGKTMYFEFKACAPDNHPMTGDISWGDGAATHLERIICGRWRVPHIYQHGGDFSANIKIENESCQGTAAPITPVTKTNSSTTPHPQPLYSAYVSVGLSGRCPGARQCWYGPPSNGQCPDQHPSALEASQIGCITGQFDCLQSPDMQSCYWMINSIQGSQKIVVDCNTPIFSSVELAKANDFSNQNSGLKISYTQEKADGSSATTDCSWADPVPSSSSMTSSGASISSVNQLALATGSTQIQKNYLLFAGIGSVLLIAAVAIGYIIRKLD